MILLLAILLAQPSLNLNQQPIMSRQNGARLSTTRQYAIDCYGGTACSVDGGVLRIWTADAGASSPGGSVNTASGVASFDGGALDARTTVTAAWATGASVIVCRPTGEESSVEGAQVTVLSQAAGSFVVRTEPRTGSHWGELPFVCLGN